MNIFWLDKNLEKAAQYHVDRHIVKMPVELAQLLSNAIHHVGKHDEAPYKLGHQNHPCSIWARESKANWKLLQRFAIELGKEYTYRYGKVHKSATIAAAMKCPKLPDVGLTKPPLCMPDAHKTTSVVKSYRNLYRDGKSHLHNWKNRQPPKWIKNGKTINK